MQLTPWFDCIIPGRLWQVRDLLPAEQVQEIITTDWVSLPWATSPQQQHWRRREILWNDPHAQQFSRYIACQLNTINQAIGTEFEQCSGQFWVDQPGFSVPLHTDGHLPNSMQLYWSAPTADYGTGFYHYRRTDSLLYQFASEPNSGYIMLNHANSDGSQPLLWHGMLNPVPEGHIRVSSYWQFS